MQCAIILVAGGASTRMGFPKLWTDVIDRPLIAHAIDAARYSYGWIRPRKPP